MVIAAVGQQAESAELEGRGMMKSDRVDADFNAMRTSDPKVFAAGDGAFGGSTIVVAMHHGQKAAYYIKAFLEGRDDPLPYRTPYRTRRVAVAQDLSWEKFPRQEQEFHGLGATPVEFPEIETAYDLETARAEAARCYRCDAETGSADYAVHHREDIFSMARTNAGDHAKNRAMLLKRLHLRENPYPEERPACLDDLVFLPANLSRLVIDPYREACRIDRNIAGKLQLAQPFFAAGFDDAPDEVRDSVAEGLAESGCGYIGARPIGSAPWLQVVGPGGTAPSPEAAGLIHALGERFQAPAAQRLADGQILGLAVSVPAVLEEAIPFALEGGFDVLVLDGGGGLGGLSGELGGAPDLTLLRDAIRILRRLGREEEIDLIHFGGARSGTDAAKLIAMGCVAVVFGAQIALAAGGEITAGGQMRYNSERDGGNRTDAVVNILASSAGEASMMARCTGKTNLHNLEPEDLRALTLAAAQATGLPLAGTAGWPGGEDA